jgi:hypothetical protein
MEVSLFVTPPEEHPMPTIKRWLRRLDGYTLTTMNAPETHFRWHVRQK